jgi:ribosome-associated heat shock protein Hsp15
MSEGLRIDRWLWFARLFKSRTLAAEACAAHHVRSNGAPIAKPGHPVRVGDVLTFMRGPHVCVVKVLALATRRGPYEEARHLYEDLSPPPARPADSQQGQRNQGDGRPTKAERRAVDRLQGEADPE